ncbi:aspartate--tRNA ligase, mitochondrial isoform X2 [Neocloeon triangulifer]|uniref:aspartate--tRNA ligase, mitochondrial isoform X2 n=1 Tax=Neocloeon triangulifer TaxID=2078957 RepID=UPI00286F3A9C|nr:aspartate--tRNA ligase, mitochondrial isoform X2 [Neocloeon triangulifer]
MAAHSSFFLTRPNWDIENISLESVVKISGTVLNRPDGQQNSNMSTGDIEVAVEDFDVLSVAKKELPITVRDQIKLTEHLRMTYRYMDLRFPEMQSRLRFRSEMISEMRKFLGEKCGFVEVETPTLFKRTPGGAQEFIVPSRMPGKCYTLVQSPQQFKQLLMVGGIDRYFQVARCYRDESARPDRQLEFTQLDIELSFTNQQGVMALAEDLISHCWRTTVEPDLSEDRFPVLKYEDVLNDYGTDKPDTRFDMKIQNISDALISLSDICSSPLRSSLIEESNVIGAIIVPKGQEVWASNSSIKKLCTEQLQHFTNPLWLRGFQVPNNSSDPWPSLGENKQVGEAIKSKLGHLCNPGDVVWLAGGPRFEALTLLGRLRVIAADELEKATGVAVRCQGPKFLWIVDFPLFEPGEQPGTLSPTHHPFTQPHPDDAHLMFTDPLKVRGQHYDLVLDGWEIAGGSVRIHNAEMQRRVLGDLLKIKPDSLHHMLEAFDSGCPPHAGIAFGIDRLIAVACGAPSIRDVIAFPKAAGGRDPMSGAPVDVTKEDQILYHINCLPKGSNNC